MYKNKTFCFSPPVMLATFFIEVFGAIYTVVRYKMDRIGKLVVAILLLLGVFQLAEYMICESISLPGLTWARIGYVAITLLPPLGISLAMALAGKKSNWQAAVYLACGAFIAYFLVINNSLTGQVCAGNYVIFRAHPASMRLYALYYFGLLALGVYLSLRWRRHTKNARTKTALLALAIGYMAFIIPTITANLLSPATMAAIPSVMCGFAVLLAITLIGWVLPNGGALRKGSLSRRPTKS